MHEKSFCNNAERRREVLVSKPEIKNEFESRVLIVDLLASAL
jgi:hypothetical protein